MFFSIKNVKNTYIIDIQVKKSGLSEGILLSKTILELARLIPKQKKFSNLEKLELFEASVISENRNTNAWLPAINGIPIGQSPISSLCRQSASQPAAHNRHIVLNFNNSKEFNNMFIEKLLFAGKFCAKNNIIISFCGINTDALSIFYLLKLDEYFEFYSDKYDAILRKNRLIKRRIQAV